MTATVPSFAPTSSVTLSVSTTSARVALPTTGTPTIAYVTNHGEFPAFVTLGSSSVVATSAGMPIMPGSQFAFTIGSNTYLAAIVVAHQTLLNITVGN